jgi:hypothetical protein
MGFDLDHRRYELRDVLLAQVAESEPPEACDQALAELAVVPGGGRCARGKGRWSRRPDSNR